jgi:ribosomal protein L10
MVTQQKRIQVAQLTATVKKNPNFVLISFNQTTHQALEKLRRDLKKKQSFLKVIKNTLFEKAINNLSTTDKLILKFKKKFLPLKEPSALLIFPPNWSGGLHTFYQFMQKEKTVDFKLGILDHQLYSAMEITRIAALPSKDQLMGTFISSLKSPPAHFVNSLRYNLQKFIYLLKQH